MNQANSSTGRRAFLKTSLAAAGAGSSIQKALGANDRVSIGFIGVGNRGSQLLEAFMKQDDVRVAALCDVYKPYRERDRGSVDGHLLETLGSRVPALNETFDYDVPRYEDFRRVLDRNDIDAVVIATPDHWHAIQTIAACQAGKDVYVEKPLSVTVEEGRKMIDTARKTGRVTQVGLHRRSSKMYHQLAAKVQEGGIGKVTMARAYRISNMYPDGIGSFDPRNPPEGMNWDLWLGPRGEREYRDDMSLYKFRWWNSYSSQVGNWGVHYFDAIRWMTGDEAPVSVCAMGGRYALHDDRTIPDTMEVTFELPSGMLLAFGQYEASGGEALAYGEIELRGVLGNLYSNERSYRIQPSKPGQFQDTRSPLKEESVTSDEGDLTEQHARNFVDCVKSRETCHCDLETGHRSTTFSHLANISLAVKSRLEWDPAAERVIGNDDANRLLHYDYRKPWSL